MLAHEARRAADPLDGRFERIELVGPIKGSHGQFTSLQPGQIRHFLRVTAATSRHSGRDSLVLLLGLTTGMRVTEIAQIEVQDVLFSSGALRDEISLRAAITEACRQRCGYMSHAKAIEAVDRCLDYRRARHVRTTDDPSRYRGLEPASKLILTH